MNPEVHAEDAGGASAAWPSEVVLDDEQLSEAALLESLSKTPEELEAFQGTMHRIASIIEEVAGGVVPNRLSEARALERLDLVDSLAEGLPEPWKNLVRRQQTIQRLTVLGWCRPRAGDLDGGIASTEAALEETRRLRDELATFTQLFQDEYQHTYLPMQEQLLRLHVIDLRLDAGSEVDAALLRGEARQLKQALAESPTVLGRLFAVNLEMARAIERFGASTSLLGALEFDAALEAASQAEAAAIEAVQLSADTDYGEFPFLEEIAGVIRELHEGFVKVFRATRLYVEAHRAGLAGGARRAHLTALGEAELLLVAAQPELGQSLQRLAAMVSQSDAGLGRDVEVFVTTLRRRIANLSAAMQAAMTPKEQVHVAWPWIVPMFAVTFVVVSVALGLTGLVERLGLGELGVIAGLSVVVAFAGAFGPTVGLSALTSATSLLGHAGRAAGADG